jgi:Zn-finger nucleic acid-binding protein
MDCVSCGEPMIALEVDQVEIDYCIECGGIWLDAGELEILLEEPEKVEKVLRNAIPVPKTSDSFRKCPICLKKMEEIELGVESKIYIDRCKSGHGLWFDRGELEEVIKIIDHDESSKVAKLLKDIFRK